MSNETLQTLAVAVIVTAAVAFLVWRRVRRFFHLWPFRN